jgi:hypothetical protein
MQHLPGASFLQSMGLVRHKGIKKQSQKQKHSKGKAISVSRQVPAFTFTSSASRLAGRLMPNCQTFPDNINMKFRYMWYGTLSSTSGAAAQQQFRLNSLYDPDLTGVGGQPRYYDQLLSSSGPYSKYRVVKTHFRVSFMNTNTSNTTIGWGYLRLSDSSAALSPTIDPINYAEAPDMTYGLIQVNSNPTAFLTLSTVVDHAKFYGGRNAYEMDELLADYNANPTDIVYAELGYRPYDLSTSASIKAVVEMVYEVQLTGLINPSASLVLTTPAPSVSPGASEVSELERLKAEVKRLTEARK